MIPKLLFSAFKNEHKRFPKLIFDQKLIKGRNFHREKLLWNKLSLFADPKAASFAEFFFVIGPFIMNFVEFVFTINRFERSQGIITK